MSFICGDWYSYAFHSFAKLRLVMPVCAVDPIFLVSDAISVTWRVGYVTNINMRGVIRGTISFRYILYVVSGRGERHRPWIDIWSPYSIWIHVSSLQNSHTNHCIFLHPRMIRVDAASDDSELLAGNVGTSYWSSNHVEAQSSVDRLPQQSHLISITNESSWFVWPNGFNERRNSLSWLTNQSYSFSHLSTLVYRTTTLMKFSAVLSPNGFCNHECRWD